MSAISEALIEIADDLVNGITEAGDESPSYQSIVLVLETLIKAKSKELKRLAKIAEEQSKIQTHSVITDGHLSAKGPVNPEELARKEAARIQAQIEEEIAAKECMALLIGGPLDQTMVQLDQSRPSGTRTKLGSAIYEKRDDNNWHFCPPKEQEKPEKKIIPG